MPTFRSAHIRRTLRPYLKSHFGAAFKGVIWSLKVFTFGHLFWEFGYSIGPSYGPSMLPTFDIMDDCLVVSKLYRFGRGMNVGDLVQYKIPLNNGDGVKRLMGLPGDYVMINSPDSGSDTMIQIPEGHCWLAGDNLYASRDSRHFGPLPMALINGKVIAKINTGGYPLQFWRWKAQRMESSLHQLDMEHSTNT